MDSRITQDEVIAMAKEAGMVQDGPKLWLMYIEDLERFAALVEARATEKANARANASWTLMCEKMVAIEREECEKVCEIEASVIVTNASDAYQEGRSMGAVACVNAIRQRGQA